MASYPKLTRVNDVTYWLRRPEAPLHLISDPSQPSSPTPANSLVEPAWYTVTLVGMLGIF